MLYRQIEAKLSVAISSSLEVLGFKELKPKQKEVLEKFVGGKDIFVSVPTGSGKSLCYWILPLVYNHCACSQPLGCSDEGPS